MAGLKFRSIAGPGGFNQWLVELRNQSGVYVIRERRLLGGWRVLYVGESHTGRLANTIRRHFQSWSGPKAGPTYDRGQVEVAVVTCPPSAAYEHQMALIARLKPKDNDIGKPPDEWVPF